MRLFLLAAAGLSLSAVSRGRLAMPGSGLARSGSCRHASECKHGHLGHGSKCLAYLNDLACLLSMHETSMHDPCCCDAAV